MDEASKLIFSLPVANDTHHYNDLLLSFQGSFSSIKFVVFNAVNLLPDNAMN
jgi:hypothetical protein